MVDLGFDGCLWRLGICTTLILLILSISGCGPTPDAGAVKAANSIIDRELEALQHSGLTGGGPGVINSRYRDCSYASGGMDGGVGGTITWKLSLPRDQSTRAQINDMLTQSGYERSQDFRSYRYDETVSHVHFDASYRKDASGGRVVLAQVSIYYGTPLVVDVTLTIEKGSGC